MKQFKITALVLMLSLIFAGSMLAIPGKDAKKKKVEKSHHGMHIKIDLSGLTEGLESLKDLDLSGLDALEGLDEKLEALGEKLGNLNLNGLADIDIHLDGLKGLSALDGLGDILEDSFDGLDVLDTLDFNFDFDYDFDFDLDFDLDMDFDVDIEIDGKKHVMKKKVKKIEKK